MQHSPHDKDPVQKTELIRQIIRYIDLNYQEPITLQSLANQFYVSRFYLAHEFSRKTGTGLYRYIIRKRLAEVKKLMDTGIPPCKAYGVCGFGDYANFYRAFRQEFGMSPKDYCLTHIKRPRN